MKMMKMRRLSSWARSSLHRIVQKIMAPRSSSPNRQRWRRDFWTGLDWTGGATGAAAGYIYCWEVWKPPPPPGYDLPRFGNNAYVARTTEAVR